MPLPNFLQPKPGSPADPPYGAKLQNTPLQPIPVPTVPPRPGSPAGPPPVNFNIMDLVNPRPNEGMQPTPQDRYRRLPTYSEVPAGNYNPPKGQY